MSAPKYDQYPDNQYNNCQQDGKYKMIQKNFILPQDKFSGQSAYTEEYNRKNSAKPAQRFVPKGQLELSKEPFQANTSYIDDYLNRGQGQRALKVQQPKNTVLPEGKFDGNTSYQENYNGEYAQKQPQYKPVGELKVGGNFEGTSSYAADYENRGAPIRPQRTPLPKNKILPEGQFQGTTDYTENFIPGRIQSYAQFKPEGQLKVGGSFQGVSSYESDYNSKIAQRAQKYPLPQNQVLPEGKFQGTSAYNDSYLPGRIQRQHQYKPEGQLKIGGEFKGSSSYLADYANKGSGLKAEKVPLPKNQVLPEGRFEGQSIYSSNYVSNRTERQHSIKHEGELKIGGEFKGATSYGQDYEYKGIGQRSEKIPLPKNHVMPQGRFEGNSAYNSDYVGTRMEKNLQYKPVGQLKVGEGKFEGFSSYSNDYENKGRVQRPQRSIQPNNKVIPQGRFQGHSAYTLDYVPNQIQRNQPYRPVEQINLGGKFEGNSTYEQTYSAPHQIKNYNPQAGRWQ